LGDWSTPKPAEAQHRIYVAAFALSDIFAQDAPRHLRP
jgi:hypothetical protein